MWTNDRNGNVESLDIDMIKSSFSKGERGIAIWMAPIAERQPQRPDEALNPSERRSRRRADVLDEHETTARSQDPPNLPKGLIQVTNRAKHERAHDGVSVLVGKREVFRCTETNLDLTPQAHSRILDVRVKERIRFDAGPAHIRCEEAEVQPTSRTNFHDIALKRRKQPRFESVDASLVVRVAASERPRLRALVPTEPL